MNCQLTPVKHADVADIAESIIPKNSLSPSTFKGTFVSIWLEPNPYASNGLAIRVDCKGRKLGYLPELKSVTTWKGEDHPWTKAVSAIRTQLGLEYDMNGTERWSGFVAECRYISTEGGLTKYKLYDEYTVLPEDERKKWRLEQVSVEFKVEEL